MGQRRKARELAVQTLYALDFAEIGEEFREYESLNQYPEILNQLAESEKVDNSPAVQSFADDLVKNTIINQAVVTEEIAKHSDNWMVEDIAPLDRSLLFVAVYELMFTDTPPPVIINEALEIAKKFCGEGTGKFLNGILDAVLKELEEKERLEGSKV